jgi:hypothetical protein
MYEHNNPNIFEAYLIGQELLDNFTGDLQRSKI